jgi:hypothetical protein
MPLSITKVAYGAQSVDDLRGWLERSAKQNGGRGFALMTTRYMPKRVSEMTGGSLFWIHSHAIIGRTPIMGFKKNDEGRYDILMEPQFIPVRRKAKRAHQGWRYLEEANAPHDLAVGESDGRDEMPSKLLNDLSKMGLV